MPARLRLRLGELVGAVARQAVGRLLATQACLRLDPQLRKHVRARADMPRGGLGGRRGLRGCRCGGGHLVLSARGNGGPRPGRRPWRSAAHLPRSRSPAQHPSGAQVRATVRAGLRWGCAHPCHPARARPGADRRQRLPGGPTAHRAIVQGPIARCNGARITGARGGHPADRGARFASGPARAAGRMRRPAACACALARSTGREPRRRAPRAPRPWGPHRCGRARARARRGERRRRPRRRRRRGRPPSAAS